MGGIVGRLLHEFSITIAIAVLVSGIVSVTLTPMLCSRLIKSAKEEHGRRHNIFYRASENGFNAIQRGYARSLNWSMKHRPFIFVLFLLSIVATVQLFRIMPSDFLTPEDTGQINGYTDGANGVSFAEMRRHQEEAAKILQNDPNIEGFMTSVGAGGTRGGLNSGGFRIQLKPRSQRALTVNEIIAELRPQFQRIPGINVVMQNRPPISIGGYVSRAAYQYNIQSVDLNDLYVWAQRLQEGLAKNPTFADVNSDLDLSTPSVEVSIDRDKAAALGVTTSTDRNGVGGRLWRATHLAHLYAGRSVLGNSGAASAIPAGRRIVEATSILRHRAPRPSQRPMSAHPYRFPPWRRFDGGRSPCRSIIPASFRP